jgi:hypothetical protein
MDEIRIKLEETLYLQTTYSDLKKDNFIQMFLRKQKLSIFHPKLIWIKLG